MLLRPDMFVDVELPISLPPAITVPADAVLDSGLKKTVFVDHGNGFFEPREVETGWRIGNRVEIVKGLKPGEQIVISGNFLIDSESRLESGRCWNGRDAEQGPGMRCRCLYKQSRESRKEKYLSRENLLFLFR